MLFKYTNTYTNRLRVQGWKNIDQESINHVKTGTAILISDKKYYWREIGLIHNHKGSIH